MKKICGFLYISIGYMSDECGNSHNFLGNITEEGEKNTFKKVIVPLKWDILDMRLFRCVGA